MQYDYDRMTAADLINVIEGQKIQIAQYRHQIRYYRDRVRSEDKLRNVVDL